jgi:aminoglycoside 6'-N-acetyltransferase
VTGTVRHVEEAAIEFRLLRRSDFELIAQWLSAPHVERWWRQAHDPASIEAAYGPAVDGNDPTELFVVLRGSHPIGLVQRYLIDDNPDWKQSLEPVALPEPAVGIDYLIGTAGLIGRGLGPVIIDRLVDDAWRRHPRVVAAVANVQQANRRSWRALEKSGFQRAWAGELASNDPSDDGPAYVYVRMRE